VTRCSVFPFDRNFGYEGLHNGPSHGCRNPRAMIALRTTFVSASREGGDFIANLKSPHGSLLAIRCARIVNAAGHGPHDVARPIDDVVAERLPPRFLATGSYCSVSGPSPSAI
jgi:hypothetical protein